MKKLMTICACTLLTLSACAQERIVLPVADLNVNMKLMDALAQRHSSRTFSQKDISDATLSQVLWAACGINRAAEKKITAPSAINAQDIVVFVCRKDGAYLYLPETNELQRVSTKDLRQAVAGRQEFAATAPISLVLASDHRKFGNHGQGAARMGMIDAGYVSENISLVCTALGLNTVPRMTMDQEVLKKELQLDDEYDLLINHPIGAEEE